MDKPGDNDATGGLLETPVNVDSERKVIINKDENETISSMTRCKVFKNLLVISTAFMIQFSAFDSFSSLQSSLNKKDGLGTTGLASLYLVMMLSSLLMTPVTASRVSAKWLMVVSMFTYLIYIATGFYPSWYTVIPASVFIGIGASHLWLAMQSYLTDISKHYATITNTKPQDKVNLFLGIFYAFMYTCNVWGNLLSSFIFHRSDANTTINSDDTICGANFCPYIELNTTSSVTEPTKQQVYIYIGSCVGLVVLAIVSMALFVTNISTERTFSNVRTLVQQVTRLLCFSRSQHLLFFPTLLGGLAKGFMTGDFTRAYVTCPYGVSNVGFVMVACGVAMSISSITFGKLTQYTGHLLIFCFGYMVQIGLCVTLLLWTPSQSGYYVVFILAAMFGMANALNEPMLAALYNLYFTKNLAVALSSLRTISSLGWVIGLGYSNWLCTQYKIYILLSVLTLSWLSITIQHIRHTRKRRKNKKPIE